MKLHGLILAFACVASVPALAIAETPKSINAPAGDLADALESLATQCGVDVIYPSGLLKGRKTRGVSGTLESSDAFRTLLKGTSLVLREEGDALLITQAPNTTPREVQFDPPSVATAPGPADPIEELTIEGLREKQGSLRAELDKLDEQFYAEYNRLNTDPDYDLVCDMRALVASHVQVRVCEPAFARGGRDAGNLTAPLVMQWARDYQKRMLAMVAQHPELLELIKERSALVRRYDDARKQELKKKTFVRN